jgi:frataxin-like iron-binding protein CyaY
MLQLLRQMRAEIGDVKEGVDRLDDKIDRTRNDVQSDIRSLRADLASDLLVHRKETGEQIAASPRGG